MEQTKQIEQTSQIDQIEKQIENNSNKYDKQNEYNKQNKQNNQKNGTNGKYQILARCSFGSKQVGHIHVGAYSNSNSDKTNNVERDAKGKQGLRNTCANRVQ